MVKSSKKSKKVKFLSASGKEERLFNNLLRITEQFMGGKASCLLSKDELYAAAPPFPLSMKKFFKVSWNSWSAKILSNLSKSAIPGNLPART